MILKERVDRCTFFFCAINSNLNREVIYVINKQTRKQDKEIENAKIRKQNTTRFFGKIY